MSSIGLWRDTLVTQGAGGRYPEAGQGGGLQSLPVIDEYLISSGGFDPHTVIKFLQDTMLCVRTTRPFFSNDKQEGRPVVNKFLWWALWCVLSERCPATSLWPPWDLRGDHSVAT